MGLFYLIFLKGRFTGGICALLLFFMNAVPAYAQSGGIIINLSPLDGVALTPENILSFEIQSNLPAPSDAVVKGLLRYRGSEHSFSYTFHTIIRQGVNRINVGAVKPQWAFSGIALQELFMDYHKLPAGAYEYCVHVTPLALNGEVQAGEEARECLYQRAEDIFLINLVDPGNNAELYEHYPVYSWIVNYPFASGLTYRIRVAEIKEGQNTVNAITRNNPVYTEGNLPQTMITHPVYGKPLVTFQPYVWTVDAYYKGILLGGAEPWKFTIVEDSEMVEAPTNLSYYEFAHHYGETTLFAVGDLKLKYVSDVKSDTLSFLLEDMNGKRLSNGIPSLNSSYADNLFAIDLRNKLSHKTRYVLRIKNASGAGYVVPFIYYNPLFVK